MYKFNCLLILVTTMVGCRSAPFKVEALSIREPVEVKEPDRRFVRDFEGVLSEGLGARYKKAKSPRFAIVGGYYKLPATKPFGAATIVRSYSYNTSVEIIATKNNQEQAYAIEPISADDADMLSETLNSLLNIGVKMKEISMSDALLIAKAEAEAEKAGKKLTFGMVLPPDVDYLISVYPSRGSRGPVIIGRVIKNDGTLVAFRVVQQYQKNMFGALVASLFEDTINRI